MTYVKYQFYGIHFRSSTAQTHQTLTTIQRTKNRLPLMTSLDGIETFNGVINSAWLCHKFKVTSMAGKVHGFKLDSAIFKCCDS